MNPTNPSSLIPILKKEWDTLQPLKVEDDKRLLKKFRLEWNYNSNHIEGNTLTYGETELLLIFGETKGNHNIREYDEMQAHDVAIKHVYDLAREKSELREADVRNLNKIILKEPFWKETITPDGSPSRRQIFPGEYKQFPNSVRTATGEIFEYASPIDVPPKMQKLVEFIRMISTNRQDLPGDLAKMHHDFSLIHPFDDGNGRVARLLVNYVLLRHGFPPVIIKSKDKKNYLSVLHNADVGNLEPFREYMAREMIWSLETAIKAAKGESIDEPGDLEKEIDVFVREQSIQKKDIRKKNPDDICRLASTAWLKIFKKIVDKTSQIQSLFVSCDFFLSSNITVSIHWENFLLNMSEIRPKELNTIQNLGFNARFDGYKGRSQNPFTEIIQILIILSEFDYEITLPCGMKIKKYYSECISDTEVEQIAENTLKKLFESIKSKSSTD